MKSMRRYLSAILTVIMIASTAEFASFGAFAESALRYVISENFEQEQRPDTFNYHEGSGSIETEVIGSDRALYLENNSDGSYTLITKTFESINDGVLVLEARFLQPDRKSDDNIILEMLSSGNTVISVVTESGNLSVKMPDGSFTSLVSGYFSDKWYKIKAEMDFNAKNCDYYIDDVLVKEDVAFYSTVSGTDTLSSYSRFSPGFYLDDIKLSNLTQYQDLTLSGGNKVAIPHEGETKCPFSANLISETGQPITGERLIWSIDGSPAGVSIVPSDDTMSANLVVTSAAVPATTVRVNVSTYGASITKSKDVNLEAISATRVKILGDARVSAYNGATAKFSYTAQVLDQLDNVIPNQHFVWELTNNSVATISINSATGELTVSGTMPDKDQKAIITARLASDASVVATKSILVQRFDTYSNDSQRLKLAISGVDNIIKAASNPDGRNPLMGFYLSPYTNTYGYWNLEGPKNPTACSNLSEQFQLMRSMDGITGLTGDESYKKRVRDIYQWQLDHGISKNGLVYWGNHTTMDLETGEWSEYFEKFATAQPYIEVKDRDVYLEPFLDLDMQAALDVCKNHWCAIINDWGYMNFNRHAIIDNESGPDYSGWNNVDGFIELTPDDPWVRSQDLCFFSSAATLLIMSEFMYKTARDETALLWGKRLLYRYLNTRNSNTGMFGNLFTTARHSKGVYSLVETFGEKWWTQPRTLVSSQAYGDRAYNQFTDTLVELGLVTREAADKEILEGLFITSNSQVIGNTFIDAMYLAKSMIDGGKVADGEKMARDYFSGVASYIKHAYVPERNIFHKVFTNGIIMDDVVWTRPGYWGSAGKTIESEKSSSNFRADNLIQGYIMTKDISGLEEERRTVWECAKNICDKTFHMGDIGNPLENERPNLNLATNSTDPILIRMLLHLYEASGWDEYLAQARIIGNNIILKKYKDGFFIGNGDLQYIDTDGEYTYVLLKLEAALRGEPDLVPESRYQQHLECDAVWRDDHNALQTWDGTPLSSKTFPSVSVTSVRLSTNDINLSVGEQEQVQVTIVPDDATSKAIFWDIKDKDIVSVTGDNTFVAQKEGETVAYAVSRSGLNMISEPVHITVTRKEAGR